MRETLTGGSAVLKRPRSPDQPQCHAPPALLMCLIVSASARRAQLLSRAAHEEHWATIVCHTAEEALRQAALQRVQLALVDLQSAPAGYAKAFKQLVEQLAARKTLLAVCDAPNDPSGEIWSRELGVWMYLPGIDTESDIALLCSEARYVVEKIGDETVRSSK